MRSKWTAGGLSVLVLFLATAASAQVGYLWTMDELTKQADLVVIAEYRSTSGFGRGTVHPELKPDLPVIEFESLFEVLTVLKGRLSGAPLQGESRPRLTLRHLQPDMDAWRRRQPRQPGLPPPGLLNTGSTLAFREGKEAYLLFLKHRADGGYDPLSGHTVPTESVFSLRKLDRPAQ